MGSSTATLQAPVLDSAAENTSEPADKRVTHLYREHYRGLVALASMLAGTRELGEEIAQETFLIALKHERRAPGYVTDPAWPWLRTTAAHLASGVRHRAARAILANRRMHAASSGRDPLDDGTVDLLRALQQLPTKMRVCIVARHLEDMSTASIAEMLGCSTQNVDNQLRKGRERLRALLGEEYLG